jgi:LPS O-antigen subunit length determinant protein (WzzB/FepE family)
MFKVKYTDFIKKKTIIETKNNLKLTIQNKITSNEQALEIANIIKLEEPILKSTKINLAAPEEDLFYKGSKVLSQNIVNLKKLLIKLENDQLNYESILEQGVISEFHSKRLTLDYLTGLIFGFLLSFVIIFFKSVLRNKQ